MKPFALRLLPAPVNGGLSQTPTLDGLMREGICLRHC